MIYMQYEYIIMPIMENCSSTIFSTYMYMYMYAAKSICVVMNTFC